MINQSSSLKELSTWDLRTLRVVRTSSSYWKWCVTAYLTSWFLHWAFKYLIFHTRHCKSRGQIYLWDLITEPQKVSNGCQRANISFSCFPWNEHNLIVRFAVNAETVETALIYGSQPWSLFFPLMTEISCATNWRALPPCTCRFPLWSCSPAHTAVYNLLRNLSNLRAAEMARKKQKKNGLDLGSESWHGTVNVTAPPPSGNGRWWVSPRCCPQGRWAGKEARDAPRIWPLIGQCLFRRHGLTEEALPCLRRCLIMSAWASSGPAMLL